MTVGRKRPPLQERPRCPKCLAQFAAVVVRNVMSGVADVVVVTQRCGQHQRYARERCPQPYAVLCVKGRPPEYLWADTFDEIEIAINERIRALL